MDHSNFSKCCLRRCECFVCAISALFYSNDPVSFQGVLTVQSYMYYETFPGDPLKLKALVSNSACPFGLLISIGQGCLCLVEITFSYC
jgi:hypothetical protein